MRRAFIAAGIALAACLATAAHADTSPHQHMTVTASLVDVAPDVFAPVDLSSKLPIQWASATTPHLMSMTDTNLTVAAPSEPCTATAPLPKAMLTMAIYELHANQRAVGRPGGSI